MFTPTVRGETDAERHQLADELGIRIWTLDDPAMPRWRRMLSAARESPRDRLPQRYATDTWGVPFRPRLESALAPGMRILDIGAGARPMLAPHERPAGCTYVGFDVDGEELRKAPPGSYDDVRVGDVCVSQPDLVSGFDLVLSWLTMEHVKPVPVALRNLASYQRPGGRFLGYLAGTFSVHAIINRLLPGVVAERLAQTAGREPDTIFKAHYHRCWYDALDEVARGAWSRSEIVPVFTGGWYFRRFPRLRAPYLAYEEWAYTGQHRNLAAYYILDAVA